jgi:hypothetical protein
MSPFACTDYNQKLDLACAQRPVELITTMKLGGRPLKRDRQCNGLPLSLLRGLVSSEERVQCHSASVIGTEI